MDFVTWKQKLCWDLPGYADLLVAIVTQAQWLISSVSNISIRAGQFFSREQYSGLFIIFLVEAILSLINILN